MEPVGPRLKKIRLEKGLSLEEVHKKTKIHLNILKAIEGDAVTDLSPVYLRGFLKIYCKYLGIDPRDFIPYYKEATQHTPVSVGLKREAYLKSGKGKSISLIKAVLQKLSFLKKARNIRIIFIFIAAFALISFSCSAIKARRASPGKAQALRRVSVTQVKAQSSVPKPQPPPTPAPKEIPPSIRLGMRAKQNCWVSLKVDGKVVFQRVLEKGRFESWVAKERMELSLGNLGAVELEVNGQLFSNLGRRGESRKNIVITKQGLDFTK